MCRAYEQGERATLWHLNEVRTLLDDEQRSRFDTMMERCLCQSCGTEIQ
jgi:ABC-type transport system involved in cytochrome c biogenesis ATPase subunit